MITELKLIRLLRAAENLSEKETESGGARRAAAALIDRIRAEPILAYLLAPYENGYWELRATWNGASPFATTLLDKTGTLSGLEFGGGLGTTLASVAVKKMSEQKREELLRITSRLSPIHTIFCAIVQASKGEKPAPFSSSDGWLAKIDFPDLAVKFAEAKEIFENRIYFDGMSPRVNANRLYQIQTGLVSCLEAPRENGNLHIVGTEHSDVCSLRDFYVALGVLKSPIISRIFAPDEALFRPYFPLVSSVLPHVIVDGSISKVFTRALDYYEDEDFQHCISTLGLIAEDFLQRIYTSLLREQISAGLTLGQTLDRLHKRIDELFPAAKIHQRSFDAAYCQISELDVSSTVESLKPVLRELVALIQEDRVHHGHRLDEVVRPTLRRTPFPSRVTESLNELLKWRNAASHNSRVPLGAHEADRTLYCLVSVVSWWQNQLATVDWSKTKPEVLDIFIQAAKRSTTK